MEKMRLEKVETAMEETVTNGCQSSYDRPQSSGSDRGRQAALIRNGEGREG